MNPVKNNFYVYCHQTKDEGKCFYIGKGKDKRAYSKAGRNTHWKRKVAKHGGFDVVILVNNISEDKAFELEENFIRQIGIKNLVNMTYGGEGCSGCIPSQETRDKMSKASKGRTVSEEHCEKVGEANKKRVWSEDTLKKMRHKHTAENNPMFGKFGKDNHCSKKVNQYSKDGQFIKIWDSMIDVERELGIRQDCVSACCRGKQKTSGGFIFKYHGQS